MNLILDLHLPHLPHRHHPDSWAVFSPDGRYRHLLRRRWDEGPLVGFVALNPSTAGEDREDSTSRMFKGFAKHWGYAGYTTANLYDAISTDPKALGRMADPVSAVNPFYLDWLATVHDLIVFAWGRSADPNRAQTVASRVWRLSSRRGGTVAVLGWTANDQPRHPLYMSFDTPLQTLTAGAHPWFGDVADRRWVDLLSDAGELVEPAAPICDLRSA